MRPILETIALGDARALLLEAATPIERIERIAIESANGRVIAQPATSTLDVPPFDRAAMDGYAVVAEDTFNTPATLTRVGSVSYRCSHGRCDTFHGASASKLRREHRSQTVRTRS